MDDSFCSEKKHWCTINSNLARSLFAIKQITFSLPKDNLRTLYFSLIHPHLAYGILAWGNASAHLLNKTAFVLETNTSSHPQQKL